MSQRLLVGLMFVASTLQLGVCSGQSVLFEDKFEGPLSDKWQITGLDSADYRVRAGGLEVRVQPTPRKEPQPLLKVSLPLTTDDTLEASVEVTVIGSPLERGDLAGLCLLEHNQPLFTVRKTNIDGFFVFAPGEVDFIGAAGEEGDPGKYTVKYWPADKSAGPLRILTQGRSAHFQVGPSADDRYQTFFQTAIRKVDQGLGVGLTVTGGDSDSERWVRFDNFRVSKR